MVNRKVAMATGIILKRTIGVMKRMVMIMMVGAEDGGVWGRWII